MDFKDLINQLKQNRIVKTLTIYAVASWVILQVIAIIFPILSLTNFHQRWVLLILLIGLPISLLLSWSRGIKTAKHRKRASIISSSLCVIIAIGGLFAGYNVLGSSNYCCLPISIFFTT